MTRVLVAGMLVLTMMTTNDEAQAKDVWLDQPGIVIQAPRHMSEARAIPLTIDVGADPRTDEALGGFLVGAVSLVLVRQDRPGIFLAAAYDPHQSGYPPEDFGVGRDSSRTSEHADPRNVLGETIEYKFGYRFVDRGSGRYFLLGGFAKWWAAPQLIRVSDPAGPAPVDERPHPVAANALAPPFVPPSRPMLELGALGGRQFLRVKLPAPAAAHTAAPAKTAKPFFTIVGLHLQNTGGSVGGVFTPQIASGAPPGAIEATVSFASFASFDRGRMNRREIPGHWVFLLFYDDQVSDPLNVTLAKTDY
jgi:hypothetical protein